MDEKYALNIVKFINKIIWYSIFKKILVFIIDKALSAFFNKIDHKFLLKLNKNSNVIIAKTLLYFFFYKTIYFKYRAAILK